MDTPRNNTDASIITKTIFYSFSSVLFCVVIILALKPLWTQLNLHVPNDPEHKVDFTQPVDSFFYVQNAELTNKWISTNPASLWFHPLVSWLINLLPRTIAANYRLWIVSLLSAFFSLILLYRYIRIISPIDLAPSWLMCVPFLPGGLGIATGNAELTCLVFVLLLMLSVIYKWNFIFPLVLGCLAILAKPNALYLIPALAIYSFVGIRNKDHKMIWNSVLGIFSILATLAIWIHYADTQMGFSGAYWQAREYFMPPFNHGLLTFIRSTARILVFSNEGALQLKFLTAICIPLIDFWLLFGITFKDESHRSAIFYSLLGLLLILLFTNNPNKVIVYVTTIPGHFAVAILFIKQTLSDSWLANRFEAPVEKRIRRLAGLSYIVFCFSMGLFFVFGTPLGWYY